MPRRVSVHASRGPRPALWYYRRDASLLRVARNWLLFRLAGLSPFLRGKNLLLRGTGMRIGRGVAIGYGAQPDLLFPHDITLEDDVTIGYGTTILCHGYLRDRYERGAVIVEHDASVGADCTVLAGVRIGAGAVVAAKSLVNRDVPPGAFWGGVPARPLGTVAERFPPVAPAHGEGRGRESL